MCVCVHTVVYLQDLTAILLDVLHFQALSFLWVAVLLQVTFFGFDLEGQRSFGDGGQTNMAKTENKKTAGLHVCCFF